MNSPTPLWLKRALALSGCSALLVLGSAVLPSGGWAALITDSPKEVIDEAWQIVYRNYLASIGDYDKDSWRQLRKDLLSKTYSTRKEAYEAIRGMLLILDDPYTRFMDPDEFKELHIDTSGELTGVGIQLSFDEDTQRLTVVAPIEDGPAAAAGVQTSDRIVGIDGKDARGMSSQEAVQLIRGPIGSLVMLTIERDDEEDFDVVIIRDRISINPVVSRINTTAAGAQVGYIRLKQFSANAAMDMSEVVKDMEAQGVDAYVLDLRFNPGGLLEASVAISDQWLDVGVPIVSIQSERSRSIRFTRKEPLTEDPLVVLVNEVSASASEILSGAIQDNDRGRLVGEQTFGKGLVQSVRGLSDGSGMTVTISKYLTPNGRDIHREGIAPDVESLLSVEELRDLGVDGLGTDQDRQYRVAEGILLKALAQPEGSETRNF
ncbi:MAG: S41 family peptidase [Synechococcus sp. SB0666_bin_14]|nr:S41 family peptidase [Synechococcus sp. SB0666_bin_14]MYG47125.1 S41 family peptidase [Synechococcus sp. SB0675_bin_6]MYJ59226.1 S41 family peptidase [Synechococcus sp. SB0672_bin_6]MYK92006.1 S41 family peptidase [Synechococcus sp. SB0669_bin_8]